jgi:hypothetical protein
MTFLSDSLRGHDVPKPHPPPRFTLERRILGHVGPVFALAASSTGNVLASGGEL